MFKVSKKLILASALLIAQGSCLAGGGYDDIFTNGLIGVGVIAAGTGAATTAGLYGAYKMAKKPAGFQRNVGRGILGSAAVVSLVGLGYLVGKSKS